MAEEVRTGEAMISITPVAVEKIKTLLAEKNLPAETGLRVFVAGGGCSGMQYGMAFEPNPREDDYTATFEGVNIVIDPISLGYLYGANIRSEERRVGRECGAGLGGEPGA